MYLRILKKDLKRRKIMNVILLIFITMAVMFIASSVNNMITVTTALDSYFAKAEVPDYWFAIAEESETERFLSFADQNQYRYRCTELLQIDPKEVTVDEKAFEYGNSLVLSKLGGTKVFDRNAHEITQIKDGEIYVSAEIFDLDGNDFYNGCHIVIESGGREYQFTLKGYTKDALFGSPMFGMARFLISDHDFALLSDNNAQLMDSIAVYTKDTTFYEKYCDLDLHTIMNIDYSGIKLMYIMDMLMAAVVLVVSICLILISMVILHFTIHFTMSEEFREIGIMKAIGIRNRNIRGLYIVKYFVISVVGALIGLILSIPFERIMIAGVSKNIIITGDDKFVWNLICSIGTAAIVVGFCYCCTRKVKKFSPMDAIRNGETGERFRQKGLIHLSQSKLPVIPFIAINDLLSGPRRFISMVMIFTLGILLIIIPVNTINTLQSESLIQWFNMSECDHVISQELLFTSGTGNHNQEMVYHDLVEVREMLAENHIEADVFQEIMFRFNISHGDQKTSSLAFQGAGDVTTDQYSYLEGTPPQNRNEVAISYIIADKIGADIGDDVNILIGTETRTYTVTAINQSMNNLGEGIRFYQEEELDYTYVLGCFGVQIKYKDHPDGKTMRERKELLKESFSDRDIYTAGEYISYMMGDVAGQIEGVKKLILAIILCINVLVAVLMVKSFITKEKSEIAILRAIGFRDRSLVLWQTMRIGMILLISVIVGTMLSTPLSKLLIEPVFRQMGAYSIEFDIKPWEVYVLYPLIVLVVTSFSAFLAAQSLRKVSTMEISNID